MKTIKEEILEKSDLPDKLENISVDGKISNITLSKVNRLICGINNLDSIKWFRYICSDEIDGYAAVNLMFFKIDKKMFDEARTRIALENVSLTVTPHIDGNTGNIHPSHSDILKSGYSKIRQLVLCANKKSDPGPNTPNIEVTDDVYEYSLKTKVHKACYFPLIEDDEKLKDNWRYKFLKQICLNLPEEILGDDILKEIGRK